MNQNNTAESGESGNQGPESRQHRVPKEQLELWVEQAMKFKPDIAATGIYLHNDAGTELKIHPKKFYGGGPMKSLDDKYLAAGQLLFHINFDRMLSHAIQAKRKPQPHARLFNLLELFPFILPPKVKREVYEPAFSDLLEDFLIKARSYNTKWACRWLKFCFVVRTGWMVVGSLWAMCGSAIAKCFLAVVPEQLRKHLGK